MGIHKYKYKDKNIVLDVGSSNLFDVDEIVYDVLDFYPNKDNEEILNNLINKYGKKDVDECISEIDFLISEKRLFAEDIKVNKNFFQKGIIKAMCLHVSHDCNLACKYCFASGGDFQMKREVMSEEVAKRAIDFLIENSGNRRNLELDFFGGEPLMNFEVVKSTVKYGKERAKEYNKNFRFTITTNALLLDDEKLEFINENMSNLVLSLDGRKDVNDFTRVTPNGKGSHDLIIDNIKRTAKSRDELGKDYYVRGTYTSYAKDFCEDVKYMSDIGLKNLSIEPVVASAEEEYALKEDDYDLLTEQYDKLTSLYLERKGTDKEFLFFHFILDLDSGSCEYKKVSGCGAGCEYIAVTPLGDIYPCHQFVGKDEFLLGNIFDGIKNNELRNEFYDATLLDKISCNDCWAKYFCGGGCHANAYNFNNDIKIPYAFGCELHRKRIECALYIKCKLKEK